MAKVTFFLGLAGSGKTFRAEKLHAETGYKIFEGTEWDATIKQQMINHLKSGCSCIIEEITYCIPDKRDSIVSELRDAVPDIEIEWRCFENNLESANWNVENRINKADIRGHRQINKDYHPRYKYPNGTKPIPIHRIVLPS